MNDVRKVAGPKANAAFGSGDIGSTHYVTRTILNGTAIISI